ncbi:MAG: winged helix DNA-binding domain-containing protein [Pseudomonadaceae bacterium]|nr:winged helix DNA-binding domain-containing protein [Pseudomonadaceae bacterium]
MTTINIKARADRSRLRRHALAAQGLHQQATFGKGLKGARESIRHLGYVQIDTISVVERAHHHVFRSRVPDFSTAMTDKLLQRRDIFEYWHHAAAFLPIEDYRFSLPYKQAIANGKIHWFKNPDRKLMSQLKQQITSEGPLRSRDLEDTETSRQGWWDWKPAKRALEQLYMQGELMVTAREGFQKTYDLPERVLPEHIDTSAPDINEFAEHVITQQLRCHALVSLKGLTYQRRNPALRQAVKRHIETNLEKGLLDQLVLASGETFFCPAGLMDLPTPRFSRAMTILSPFDNALIQRERLKSIFDFDYQIECYVPAAKRKFGYFGLPLLYRDEFVGQVDCKAHRKNRRLEVKAVEFCNTTLDPGETGLAFAQALTRFAHFQACERIELGAVSPGSFAEPVRQALAQPGQPAD